MCWGSQLLQLGAGPEVEKEGSPFYSNAGVEDTFMPEFCPVSLLTRSPARGPGSPSRASWRPMMIARGGYGG